MNTLKIIKNNIKPLSFFLLGFFIATGIALSFVPNLTTAQQSDCQMTQENVENLYQAIFHRDMDTDAEDYIGHQFSFVVQQMQQSQEQTKYNALYKSMKSLEEAQREPGEISEENQQIYKDYIDQSAAIINEWAKTLPEQASEDKVIGPEQAREAIQNAYQNMNQIAQQACEQGLLQAQRQIGKPSDLPTPSNKKGQ